MGIFAIGSLWSLYDGMVKYPAQPWWPEEFKVDDKRCLKPKVKALTVDQLSRSAIQS
jgi:hypothetical protein